MAFSAQADLAGLAQAYVQVVTVEHNWLVCCFAECGCKRLICLESCPHLISVSEALNDKRRQGIVMEQVGLEPHCHAVEVRTAHSQVLTSWTSSHLFSHLLAITLGQPASPLPEHLIRQLWPRQRLAVPRRNIITVANSSSRPVS